MQELVVAIVAGGCGFVIGGWWVAAHDLRRTVWPSFEGVGWGVARSAASVGEVRSSDEPGDMVSKESEVPVKFDRNAYQRAYMRKWRAARKGKPNA